MEAARFCRQDFKVRQTAGRNTHLLFNECTLCGWQILHLCRQQFHLLAQHGDDFSVLVQLLLVYFTVFLLHRIDIDGDMAGLVE